MARKSTTSKKTSSSGRKKTPTKKSPARTKTRSKRSTKSTRSSSKSRQKKTQQPERQGLSLARKLDIAGILLALVGFLTLLSLFSPINGGVTSLWNSLLGKVFGLGVYLFAALLVAGGLWLILRNFDRVPRFSAERILGFVLLLLFVLASIHFVFAVLLQPDLDTFTIAAEEGGGGYLGASALYGLQLALGDGGAAVVLVAFLIIAIALAFNTSIWEMVRWIPPLFERLQDWSIEKSAELRNRRKAKSGAAAYLPGMESIPKSEPASGVQVQPPTTPASTGLAISMGLEAREWAVPSVSDILDSGGDMDYDDEMDLNRARVIEETLASFGAPARVIEINRGPTITQFGVEPDYIESRSGRMRVRVSKIAALVDDLALALSARTIRVQAPVPGKGYVGIEVPNDEISLVALRDVIESQAFGRLKSPLRFALGQNVAGNAMAADLSGMPHLLIAGATGSGKSVCVNSLICCLLMHNTPDDLRLVMVDPKRVELTGYNGVPHLLAPVVVELEKVVAALQWILREMDMRYRKLAEAGCRNIQEYNAQISAQNGMKLPYLVVVIDELADLMMLAPDDTERTVTRLAQLARATGIHMVIATQRPSVDVVTGLIKANFPARIAFAVASGVDSRVILDQLGAERLLGRGDMLFQAPDAPAPVRLQGVFVSENEIFRLVNYWKGFSGVAQTSPTAAGGIVGIVPSGVPLKQIPLWEEADSEPPSDPLYAEAVDLIRRQGRASISMLQRRLRIGYTRSARLIENMEDRNIVGPPDPSTGTREVLDYGPAAPPVDD
jgi:S-DNA-T family DNA segregation ATPase FtsK/SpoIIIE